MAYVNQDRKSIISANIKPLLKQYGLKGSLSIENHSTLRLTLASGDIDFIGNTNEVCGNNHYYVSRGFTPIKDNECLDINPYHFDSHFDGIAAEFLEKAFLALKGAGWYDRSDIQTDYFDVAYYVRITVGKWSKPYEYLEPLKEAA